MRALIQRVLESSVSVNGDVKSSIQQGILVLLGAHVEDTDKEIAWLSKKVVNLRIFEDENGVMNKSLLDTGGDLMVVSQFTLYANTKKGNRPSYISAAPGNIALPLYQQFVEACSNLTGKPVATGEFGADMKIQLINDGPVTIWIDSSEQR